ncbi:glycerophosphodiester phosphodiesterase [Chitinimonas sp. BJB300]|uniref:glycerophosphodiester phosphodiesterase n=1 Tax=Chitinimonas sp. BJB300 TaxID=1559339 RepID=UPI000C0EDCC6|nr:glycerophosphodiester phosphodiesterase family protein [Chitinimonas sp. BJB300]PHV13343.1 hypothetical protein CSQ89_00875 [Chitinimonas sp. BJB300]TSJ85260.1 hypothetical protein FG002_017760 [Chitinimonas sp. BJB300]
MGLDSINFATNNISRNQNIESSQSPKKDNTGDLTHFSENDIDQMMIGKYHSELLKERTGHHLLLTAHRGMGPTSVFGQTFPKDYLPENSLQSIKHAILQGADAIEIDIFKSADGIIVVTHDDEIWRNEFGADKKGGNLPAGETKNSYLVGKRTVDELKNISIGPNGETMPTLSEVLEMVGNANEVLAKNNKTQVVLNIELKDASAIAETIDLLSETFSQNSGVCLNNIVFCSFHHQALISLKDAAEERGLNDIRIAPGIKTSDLFGKENVNADFSLKPNAEYQANNIQQLKQLVEGNGFTGYDGILWDIRNPLIELALANNKEIHASTSDFRQYGENRDFANTLLEISKRVDTFFKCDNIDDARKVLLESSILMSGIGIQMMHKNLESGEDSFYFYQPRDQQDNSHLLREGIKKPPSFSTWLAINS